LHPAARSRDKGLCCDGNHVGKICRGTLPGCPSFKFKRVLLHKSPRIPCVTPRCWSACMTKPIPRPAARRTGAPWTSDGFRTSWGKIVAKAKVTGLTFHDLRATAVTRFALGGCSKAEIATITGHSLKDVGATHDAHYPSRESRMAESALEKREGHDAGTKVPNCPKPFQPEHGLSG